MSTRSLASVCIDVILWPLLVNNPFPHRCPLWLFFGFASRGGVVRATDGLCRPGCPRSCCAGNGGPRSPPSRPLGRALRLVGLVGEHGATLHRTYLRVLLLCPLGKARSLALPVGLSRRGRIPSAVNNLVQLHYVGSYCVLASSSLSFVPKISPLLPLKEIVSSWKNPFVSK